MPENRLNLWLPVWEPLLYRRLNRAFTLIELLVVIAIIAILAAILFPVFAQAKEAAKKTACLSNQKQMITATMLYLGDFDDRYPIGEGSNPQTQTVFFVHDLTSPYRKNADILQCPSYPKSPSGQDITGNPVGNQWGESLWKYVFARTGQRPTATYRYSAYIWNWGLFGMYINFGLQNKWAPMTESEVPQTADTIAYVDGYMPRMYNRTETTGGWIDWWYKWEIWPKHTDGMPISFADGHSKFYRFNGLPKGGRVQPGCANYTSYATRPNYYDYIVRVSQATLNACGIKKYPNREADFECVPHPGSSPNFGDISGVPGTCVADTRNF